MKREISSEDFFLGGGAHELRITPFLMRKGLYHFSSLNTFTSSTTHTSMTVTFSVKVCSTALHIHGTPTSLKLFLSLSQDCICRLFN